MRRTALKRKPKTARKSTKTKRVACPVARCGGRPYREGLCGDFCRKHLVQQLDTMSRARVRARDAVCRKCGSERALQWSHWPSRSYLGTRWLDDGAVMHCAPCHVSFTYSALEHEAWMRETFGEPKVEALKKRALDYSRGAAKIDLIEVWDYLTGEGVSPYAWTFDSA